MTALYVAVALTFGCAAVLGTFARPLARRLPPATATVTLTVGAVVVALSSLVALATLAAGVLGFDDSLARAGHWSVTTLRTVYPEPSSLSRVALGTFAILVTYACFRALRTWVHLSRAARVGRRMGDGAEVVVVQSEVPDAYALPGASARVVVSTAMLDTLRPDERRVLLAHERSHLRHHHHVYVQLTDVAAAMNPLLRPVVGTVRGSTERWADEDAATEVGDRRLAATALARAGLARASARRLAAATALAMPGADDGVADRARALLRPPQRSRRVLAASILALAAVSLAFATASTSDMVTRFDRAQDVCTTHCIGAAR